MNKLTQEQIELFNCLHNDRVEDYRTFSKKDYGGLFRSVVDKYPESAHFIYELLQNADDACASEVHIVLQKDCLMFKHNGTKHFDITPLDSIETGDINAITGIGNSTKLGETQNKIGKFGVGFKAVFQYTDTPEIYDDTFCFKIENYIIPTLIDENPNLGRKFGETLFVFRFQEKKKEKAFNEILHRLKSMQNPILFLQHLKKIAYRIDSLSEKKEKEFTYDKECLEKSESEGVTIERFRVTEPQGTKYLFLFSEQVIIKTGEVKKTYPIFIGYYYDEKRKELITKECVPNIYCFFPTKETFKTCFIAHAPFLLTDNRQNLKPGEELNSDLIHLLARLAAKSVVLLRDYGVKHGHLLVNENLTYLLPNYQTQKQWMLDSTFERPVVKAFNEIIVKEPLFLTRNDKYVLPNNAYTTTKGIFDLLDQNQFEQLKQEKNIDFLQCKLAQNILNINECGYYISVSRYEIEDFGENISAEFMHLQSYDWVIKFYKFLLNHAVEYIRISEISPKPIFRNAPIIKNQNDEWVKPFNNYTEPNVYFPVDERQNASVENYNFINIIFLENESAKKLFDVFGFKQPNQSDYICNILLRKYANVCEITDETIRKDFANILRYFQKIQGTREADIFIEKVSSKISLMGKNHNLCSPKHLYIEKPQYKAYLGDSYNFFFDFSFYDKDPDINRYKKEFIEDLVCRIGVRKVLIQDEVNRFISQKNVPNYISYALPPKSKYDSIDVFDKTIVEFYNKYSNLDKKASVCLWNDILPAALQSINNNPKSAEVHAFNSRSKEIETYCVEVKFIRDMKLYPWIYDKNDKLRFLDKLHIEELASEYNLNNGVAEILGIEKATQNLTEKYGVSDDVQQKYEFGAQLSDICGDDISQEEALQALKELREKKQAERIQQQHIETKSSNTEKEAAQESIEERLQKKWEEKKGHSVGKPHSISCTPDMDSFETRSTGLNSTQKNAPFFEPTKNGTTDVSAESTARAEKNLKAKDTAAQNQAESAKEQVEILDLLNSTPQYTFRWFKILMELMHASQDKITERRVQIDFSRHEMTCSDKILHLSEPTQPVPTWLCDAEKYSIAALAEGKSAKIDGLIVKSEDDSIDISIELKERMLADINQAKKIRIIATDNTNIVDSLETRFLQLNKEDDFDMNANLPKNLSFLYGPPGTGKTSELVRQVHDLLVKEPNAKILVLTPTNKAADVVAIKMSNDEICEGGLARYGATESLYLIEEIGCVTNRETTFMDGYHNIVVATAARYAYDYVQPNDTFLCDYPWDYIFIDEASMIDILTITYVIYKGAEAKKIIISGDPKQIQPVAQNDMPALNIYDMVDLHGFSKAIFDYNRYPVKGLTMQHRSIPVIGNLVSKFAYDGLVDYDPNRAPMKPLELDGLQIKNINFVGFDVAEFDDIKGLNAIKDSAFNLYSAIFTYNLIEYTIKQIEKRYPKNVYSLGVVCAYRAQSDAIKDMLENRPLDTAYCKVTCGTVHSFQGDECDIMFIVLNPPAKCSAGTHINNENIINVAMSRARDYIFFILPNGQQDGFFMKNRIGQTISITDRTILKCSDVERVMFGNADYIQENTHVTCHMPVNVYCEDNALYEVRMSDDALDIKINQK